MQFFTTTLANVALLASMLSLTTTAAPATLLETRQSSETVVTFSGAGSDPPTYTLTPPFGGENITIGRFFPPLSSPLLPLLPLAHNPSRNLPPPHA